VVAQLLEWHVWSGWRRFSGYEVFFSSIFFFPQGLGIHAEPLKNQLYHLICICFEFDHHSFDFYFFFILMLLEGFFNSVPCRLIPLDFYIQYDLYSFDCYCFILCINFFYFVI